MSILAGIGYCIGAALRYAEDLKSVYRVKQLKDLAKLVEDGPRLVEISGGVGSDAPIRCQYSDSIGAIVVEMAQKHFMAKREVIKDNGVSTKRKDNDDNKEWVRDSVCMRSRSREVPWYLDDGTGRVRVEGAPLASGFDLTEASKVYEDQSSRRSIFFNANQIRSLVKYVGGEQDVKMLGITRSEWILPIGKPLTVIGEAIKDSNGAVRIHRPLSGEFKFFYVSDRSVDTLVEEWQDSASFWKRYSVGFTVAAVILTLVSGCECPAP
ncbi:hypothetical protein Tsubulata_049440 [Turnera subulata]|uniref:RING-type E3 ubiquitin transferase n=1 Tax=Turnera subulata TaxID=218843 RepID=A0A9Q0IZX9_9ROSI|nr:hypothetical protein Tsubulata_049440 [Turnera subulata]